MTERDFTVGELEELGLPWENLASEVVSEHRWYTRKTAVFEHDGAFWQVEFMDPASELQEGQETWDGQDSDGDDTVVKATQVEKRPVTVERWFPIEARLMTEPTEFERFRSEWELQGGWNPTKAEVEMLLAEIDRLNGKAAAFDVLDRVRHPEHGDGTVTGVDPADPASVLVLFDDHTARYVPVADLTAAP